MLIGGPVLESDGEALELVLLLFHDCVAGVFGVAEVLVHVDVVGECGDCLLVEVTSEAEMADDFTGCYEGGLD